MKKVAVLFFSTSRYEYLFPMLESFEKNVDFEGTEVYKIFIDDYPKNRDDYFIDYIKTKYKIDNMVLNEENLGYSVSWGKAWSLIPDDVDYIWHQEDDMEILEKVNILEMINIMENSPTELYQLFLKRNICYEGDNDFVRQIETGKIGTEITVNEKHIVTFRSQWFIAHPGLYPKWVTQLKYPFNPQEGILPPTILQHKPNSYAAIYGNRLDTNRILHLGEYSQGQKCLEGEPGYNTFGQYDKNTTYYSLKFLTEWKGSRNYEMAILHKKYGTPDKVAYYYKKSLEEDNDLDRKYIAALYLANLDNSSDKVLYRLYLEKAIDIYPERLEAWYKLMMLFKDNNKKQLAYAYGAQGYEYFTKYNDTNSNFLFKETAIYDYLFCFNLCIVAFYSGHKDQLHKIANYVTKYKTPDYIYEQHMNNMKFYVPQNNSSISRSHYKAPSVLIIDNFLPDPMKEREFALNQEFPVTGNYPGTRSNGFETDVDKKMFETILGKKITYWPVKGYNGCYQYCTKDMKSWIHRDQTKCSAMIYLTPNPPPNTGTKTFVHKKTGTTFEKDNINKILDNDSYNMDAWNVCDVIENKFNRLVIFQGIYSHMSADYFGDCKENARLFKIFFFDVEDAQQ